MTAILTDQATSIDTAMQTADGSVVVTASGEFNGASLGIMIKPDGLDEAPVAVFRAPGSEIVDFPAGTEWFARLVVRDKYHGVVTAVDLDVTPLT